MGSFPMKVSFVWPFPRSSKMVTSYAPSIASCSIPNCAGSILFPFESEKYIRETIFSYGTISWYSTAFQNSCPSGDFMQQRNFPPTRKSISQTGAVKPFGPHHCITYFGSVHAFHTNSRGASKTLVTTIRSISLTVFFVISDLLLHFLHHLVQLVETLFPESAIVESPVADRLDRLWPQRAQSRKCCTPNQGRLSGNSTLLPPRRRSTWRKQSRSPKSRPFAQTARDKHGVL